MQPIYDYGDVVRVTRNVRNDGSFPGADRGDLLIRRGEIGHVRNIGTFLQDQIIYTVHFLNQDLQVGCREEELIPASDPWVPSRFENRDKVLSLMSLAINGEILVPAGTEGQVMKVLRHADTETVTYHVHFPGRMLQVPENALAAVDLTHDSQTESLPLLSEEEA